MSKCLEPLPAHWQYYADRAAQTHRCHYDDFALGREELLDETLNVIQAKTPFSAACCERLDRLPQNRAKKHRRLRRLFRKWARQGCPRRARPQSAPVAQEAPLRLAFGAMEPAGANCDSCAKPLTAAEHHAYGARCENCWVADTSHGCSKHAAENVVDLAESMAWVRSQLSPDQWVIECSLVAGQTYAKLANARNISPESLKMRAARWRADLRAKLGETGK